MFVELVAIFASLLVPTVGNILYMPDKQPAVQEEPEDVRSPIESRIEREIRHHEYTKCLLNESRESEQNLKSRIKELEDGIALSGGRRASAVDKFCEERARNYMLTLQKEELERGIEEAFELAGEERNFTTPLVTDLHAMVQNLAQ